MNPKRLLSAAITSLVAVATASAQLPPTTVTRETPRLRRDRTQRILVPKIIQCEDERIVTDELIDLVGRAHGSVRRRAIIALGRIGSPRGIAPLVTTLQGDRDPQMRALAAFALGEIESHHAVTALLQKLEDVQETLVVRARAAEALGKIAANKTSAAGLGSYGTGAIASLLARLLPDPSAALSEDEKLLGSLVLTALLRLRKAETAAAVRNQLRSRESDLRWQAANALARIGEGLAAAVPDLLGLLGDSGPLVRAHAARALGAAKDKRATEPLTRLLADSDERVVANSIVALGAIGDRRAVEPLITLGSSLLDGFKSHDRRSDGVPPQQNLLLLVCTALGNIGDERALPLLKSVRVADGKLGSSPEVEVAVARFGESAFFDVPGAVKLPKDDWRAAAAYAQGLGKLGGDRARFLLLDLLAGRLAGRPDPRAVPEILRALGALKPEGLRDLLLEQLKAGDVIVRATAASLLGDLGDSSQTVIEALQSALRAARTDSMNDARIAILEAAQKLKASFALQVLTGSTRDPDYVVRKRADELLRESSSEESSLRVEVGSVNSGHDRAYWRRIAQLATSAKNPQAIIRTKKGDIRIELLASDAPMTVDNFIQLARRGFYNGTTFMRVVPNFVIQGGDPRGDMNGGPDHQIRCEINLRRYETGTVGMALSGKDTGGSQFFITHSPQPHLDGGYTVFGRVVGGMAVVNRVASGERIEAVEIIN